MRKNVKNLLVTGALAFLATGAAAYVFAADSKSSPPMSSMTGGMMQGGQHDMSGMMNMMQQMNQMMESCNAMMKSAKQSGGDVPQSGQQQTPQR